MKTVLIMLVIGFLTMAASRGKDQILQATCVSGEGCTFRLLDVTGEEMDMVLGTDKVYSSIGSDDLLVHAKVGDGWKTYIERDLTRGELDRLYGGDGYTMIYLFDPQVQPKDGAWKGRTGTPVASPCVADIGSYLGRIQGLHKAGTIRFPKPFKPEFLLNNAYMRWVTVAPNRFRGVMDFGGGLASPMKLVYNATIVNEERIEGAFEITVSVPAQVPCRVTVPVSFDCVVAADDEAGDPLRESEEDDLLPVRSKGDPVDELLPVKPKGEGDDLLPVKSKGNPGDELLPVTPKSQGDDLLPVRAKGQDDDLLPIKPKGTSDDLRPVKPKKN